MARKDTQSIKLADLPTIPETPPEVESVGVREFRAKFRDYCGAHDVLIVTRGRYEVAVVLPVKLGYWSGDAKQETERKRLLKNAHAAIERLFR
jgi:hypothetical protein